MLNIESSEEKPKRKTKKESEATALEFVEKDIAGKKAKHRKAKEEVQKQEFENILEEKVESYQKAKPKSDEEKVARATETVAREERLKKMRKEILFGEKSEEEARKLSPVEEHLKNSLSAYPELQTPEIKKAFAELNKNEKIYDSNKGSAKKSAQEKARQAAENIKEAKKTINAYVGELAKNYDERTSYLAEKAKELFGENKGSGKHAPGLAKEINAVYQKHLGKEKAYNLEKRGFFGGTRRFFQDRQLKKKLGKDEWDKFETLRLEYDAALADYNAFLDKYAKKFGRLNEEMEAGEGSRMLSGPEKRKKFHEV